jgi:hypothetical protein
MSLVLMLTFTIHGYLLSPTREEAPYPVKGLSAHTIVLQRNGQSVVRDFVESLAEV